MCVSSRMADATPWEQLNKNGRPGKGFSLLSPSFYEVSIILDQLRQTQWFLPVCQVQLFTWRSRTHWTLMHALMLCCDSLVEKVECATCWLTLVPISWAQLGSSSQDPKSTHASWSRLEIQPSRSISCWCSISVTPATVGWQQPSHSSFWSWGHIKFTGPSPSCPYDNHVHILLLKDNAVSEKGDLNIWRRCRQVQYISDLSWKCWVHRDLEPPSLCWQNVKNGTATKEVLCLMT